MKIDRRTLATAGLAVLSCGIFAGSYHSVMAIRQARQKLRYQPRARGDSGPELALVFIGSSNCGACRSPDLPGIVERLKLLLLQRARDRGRSFAAIGIAVDVDSNAGFEFLQRFGRFDEIISGRAWLSLGCRRYLQEIPGTAATPQVVVVSRNVVRDRTGDAIREEHAVLRKVGLEQLQDWVELGGPIPILDAPAPTSEVVR
jgi:hypothetical protein